MSGRSAYVRKKITEPNKDKSGRNRAKSSSSDNQHHEIPAMSANAMPDFPMPTGPVGTGVGTTNARFLKFSDPMSPHMEPVNNYVQSSPSIQSVTSGGSGGDSRRDGYGSGHGGYGSSQGYVSSQGYGASQTSHSQSRPLDEYAYARARKPTIKTEDVSGIEKSGLRSILDRRTDGVRKGLAKTFTFKKKDRDDNRSIVERPQSAATVRPDAYAQEAGHCYDDYAPTAAIQMQQQHFQEQQQHFQDQQHNPQHYPTTPNDIWDVSVMAPPPPANKLPPIPQGAAAPPIKRWIGAGRPVGRWNKLRKDPELWDPNGDVLVFLGHKGQSPRPPPSFRLSSHIIEATESRYLVTLLREGSTEEDINMPPSPSGAPPPLLHDFRGGAPRHMTHGMGRGGQPTPPTSEDASLGEADGQISYEMYFPTPSGLNKIESMRHQLTTRNVFALLYHASLVGLSLYQALADLHTRLDSYMPPESDNVGQIINYLSARGIDDVRSEPETAVSLLAWSEGSEVRWEEGWRECFMHCVGMYGELESSADFKFTTPITRALLERACLETQLRVQAAEERLTDFAYGDMWPVSASGPAREAAERLQEMLQDHYTSIYGNWPPPPPPKSRPSSPEEHDSDGNEEMWLTRTVTAMMQKDFGALYDYLVNRDIVWDESEARSGRKWMMASEGGNRSFEADIPELPMTDMLIEFDNKLRFPHIPHPYPLIPESVPPITPPGGKSSRRGGDAKGANAGRGGAVERRVHLAYTESTNIYILGSEFTASDLIDAYVKFEKTDRVGDVDPAMARRGRWVLIYGILQTLASVSVDSPNVRFRDGVPYHLSPRLRGTKTPPWRGAAVSSGAQNEASHELSHCWMAPRMWTAGNMPSSGGESSGGSRSASPVMGSTAAGGLRTTSRNSVIGYANAPMPRSARSYNAPSAISESDGGSTMRSQQQQQQRVYPRMRSREQVNRPRMADSSFGPPLDDMNLPVRRRDFSSVSSAATGASMIGAPTPLMGAPTPMLGGLNPPNPYLGMADLSPGSRGRRGGDDDYDDIGRDGIRDFDA